LDNQVLTRVRFPYQAALGILAAIAVSFLGLLGFYQFRTVDPYVQSVLTLHGDIAQGNAIFQMNCAGCHGTLADGLVGPSLRAVSSRKSEVSMIYQVTSGRTPPMPQFQPSPQEMADLLRYLESL
jgi:mono/diheme cytochrome c family protein